MVCYDFATVKLVFISPSQPIHGFWDVKSPRHCINSDHILLIPGTLNAVLDFFIVAIPLPLLWKLRTSTYQKWVLTGIFACGGLYVEDLFCKL